MLPKDLELIRFLTSVHPYDSLDIDRLKQLVSILEIIELSDNETVYEHGDELKGLYLVFDGEIEVKDENDIPISILGPRNSFGERGLVRDGQAITTAVAQGNVTLLLLPSKVFRELLATEAQFVRFYDRRRPHGPRGNDLTISCVEVLMTPSPITLPSSSTAQAAAQLMAEKGISSVCVRDEDGNFVGLVTVRDLSAKILAPGLPTHTCLGDIMTADPVSLSPSAIGSDVLHTMMERRIGQVPIVTGGELVGIVTQTDLTRFQAISSAELVSKIASAESADDMIEVTAQIPRLLMQLVASGNRHEIVTRLITDIADTATRRLLTLGEQSEGPSPIPYLWLACGSQGRQEQTGTSDQDNCLILDNSATENDIAYFHRLAKFVCDGLATCGYYHCPGEMMATNPRWCQPQRVWREYFAGWIANPDPTAQMLASVMFDLRPIGGTFSLFEGLQTETLEAASKNSIFVAHMIANSLQHQPPLGLIRSFATIRSGIYRNKIDLKHNGAVPVVDLGRVYAMRGELAAVNTRARIEAAGSVGIISSSGARDLIDAYDVISETRLEQQVKHIKSGSPPDNFMAPTDLSDFERSHLRNAFVVVKTMQAALSQGQGALQ